MTGNGKKYSTSKHGDNWGMVYDGFTNMAFIPPKFQMVCRNRICAYALRGKKNTYAPAVEICPPISTGGNLARKAEETSVREIAGALSQNFHY